MFTFIILIEITSLKIIQATGCVCMDESFIIIVRTHLMRIGILEQFVSSIGLQHHFNSNF